MQLFVFDFIGSYTGGSLVVIAESEDQVVALYNAKYCKDYLDDESNDPKYLDTRPTTIYHSWDEYTENYQHRSELMLVESFDVPNQAPRIVTDSYHSG